MTTPEDKYKAHADLAQLASWFVAALRATWHPIGMSVIRRGSAPYLVIRAMSGSSDVVALVVVSEPDFSPRFFTIELLEVWNEDGTRMLSPSHTFRHENPERLDVKAAAQLFIGQLNLLISPPQEDEKSATAPQAKTQHTSNAEATEHKDAHA